MNRKLLATTSISIHATPAEVWQALINPAIIKEYMYGTETRTDWVLGSPITFSGEYNGKSYIDKGEILAINPERVLSYSYWSSLSGTDDFEDNYAHITYHLSEFDDETILVITQDNLEDDEEVIKVEDNWMKVSHTIKSVVEENSILKKK
ncbi:SRPBCC domain-containing protein [Dyadobacter sp. NIV53]|uniref:SRPBCC domain-containing protein n=1 Tax=Dyadobacter sp. NIV53 TaxID=2861765 RepID=UPI001C88E239|nr:SRPBCC domain-containing protein [Dyadobacter sp. NIV53]